LQPGIIPIETAEPPLIPTYVRAQALLAAGQSAAATAEFQTIVQHRVMAGNFVIGVLSRLGLARAYGHSGEVVKARAEYQNVFSTWKDAENSIPVLSKSNEASHRAGFGSS
jgi:hypothetical protein